MEDLITHYLQGTLSEDEKIAFEKRMQDDANFKEEVEHEKEMYELVKQDYLFSLSSDLIVFEKGYKRKKRIKKGVFTVAGLSAISLLGVVLFNLNGAQTKVTASENDIEKSSSSARRVIDVDKDSKSLIPEEENNVELGSNARLKATSIKNAPSKSIDINQVPNSLSEEVKEKAIIKEEEELTVTKTEEPESTVSAQEMPNSSSKEKQELVQASLKQEPEEEIECIKPIVNVSIVNSDLGEDNGKLILESSSIESIEFKIDGIDDEYQQDYIYPYLEAGDYHLYARNLKKCEYDLGTFTVGIDPCTQKEDLAFNRNINPEINLKGAGSKQLIVSSLMGGMVLNSLNNDEDVLWDGLDENGNLCTLGMYTVTIVYDNNVTCNYNVIVQD